MTSPEANEFFDSRTEEEVGGVVDGHTKPAIPFKQSTGQAPKKNRGRARLVVEYFFEFSPEFLAEQKCQDGVDYLRQVADDLTQSVITLDDVDHLASVHGDLDWRIEAAK